VLALIDPLDYNIDCNHVNVKVSIITKSSLSAPQKTFKVRKGFY